MDIEKPNELSPEKFACGEDEEDEEDDGEDWVVSFLSENLEKSNKGEINCLSEN